MALETLDVSECVSLRSLAPLVHHSELREVIASCSGVADAASLGMCAALEDLRVECCDHLRSLAPLAGSKTLRRLVTTNSAVSDITGLGACSALEEVVFDGCSSLASLEPLSGAKVLRTLSACGSGVEDVAGLNPLSCSRGGGLHPLYVAAFTFFPWWGSVTAKSPRAVFRCEWCRWVRDVLRTLERRPQRVCETTRCSRVSPWCRGRVGTSGEVDSSVSGLT